MNFSKRTCIAVVVVTVALAEGVFYLLLPAIQRMHEDSVYSRLPVMVDAESVTANGPQLTLVDPSGLVLETGEQAKRVFLAQLIETNADLKRAFAALERNSKFQGLWAYVTSHRLALCIDPTLRNAATGKPQFGSFRNRGSQLTLNPAHPEIAKNPLELLDTLLHECIHAAQHMRQLDQRLPSDAARIPYPLAANVLDGQSDSCWIWAMEEYGLSGDELRKLKCDANRVAGDEKLARLKEYLDLHYGSSTSNPETQYEDINCYAQKFIVDVLTDVAKETKLRQTISFDRFAVIARARGQELDAILPSRPFGIIRLGERVWRQMSLIR